MNSALTRARTTLARQRAAGRLPDRRVAPPDEVAQSLARRYVTAWQDADMEALAMLLKSEVVMTMPPLPLRYTGRAAVSAFLSVTPVGGAREQFRFIYTRANRQPALAAYRRTPDGEAYRAWGVFVLGVDGEAIAEITAFVDPTLLLAFGLPSELAGDVGIQEQS